MFIFPYWVIDPRPVSYLEHWGSREKKHVRAENKQEVWEGDGGNECTAQCRMQTLR